MGIDPLGGQAVQNFQVNPASFCCRCRFVDTLAEIIKRDAEPFGIQLADGPESILQFLARDESRGQTPSQSVPGEKVFGKLTLGEVQEERTEHRGRCPESGARCQVPEDRWLSAISSQPSVTRLTVLADS